MATDVSTFRIRFPEFADDTDFPDARVQLFLDDAANCYIGTDENRWCNRYDKVHAYLAAHLLTVGTRTEVGDSEANEGAIVSKAAGSVSLSRNSSSANRSTADEFYMSTAYGQQFITLRDSCLVGVVIANSL
jgi:hypothetical protein